MKKSDKSKSEKEKKNNNKLNKRMIKIIVVIILLLMLIPIKNNLKDGESVEYKAVLYKITKIDSTSEKGLEIKLLGIKVYKNTSKKDYLKCNNHALTPTGINDLISDYYGQESAFTMNLAYNYVDKEKNVVVVGVLNLAINTGDSLLENSYFSSCGSEYIDGIKNNEMIDFRNAVDSFEGEIVKSTDYYVTVKILNDFGSLKKNDEVTVKFRKTSGLDEYFSTIGNKLRFSYNSDGSEFDSLRSLDVSLIDE